MCLIYFYIMLSFFCNLSNRFLHNVFHYVALACLVMQILIHLWSFHSLGVMQEVLVTTSCQHNCPKQLILFLQTQQHVLFVWLAQTLLILLH